MELGGDLSPDSLQRQHCYTFEPLASGSYIGFPLIWNQARVGSQHLGLASYPIKQNGRPHYHPLEEIAESTSRNGEDTGLTSAETTRTIIEVNGKASLIFIGVMEVISIFGLGSITFCIIVCSDVLQIHTSK